MKTPSVNNITPRAKVVWLLCGLVAFISAAGIAKAVLSGPMTERDLALTAIQHGIAKLSVKSRSAPSVKEQAVAFRSALARGDYPEAHTLFETVLARSQMRAWDFHPFDTFMEAISATSDPSIEGQLDGWVNGSKEDPVPRLVRAQFECDMAWLKRGHDFAGKVSADGWIAFRTELQKAAADIDIVLHLTDRIPYSFYLKLRIIQGTGARAEWADAFSTATAHVPGYFPIYRLGLANLQPKWGGSVSAMYDFADTYAGNAAEHSPLKLLYVELYSDLLDHAWVMCSQQKRANAELASCIDAQMQALVRPSLEKAVVASLRLYDHTDHDQFGITLSAPLLHMFDIPDGGLHSGILLQLAADGMHSDPQLQPMTTTVNDYMIDLLTAESWYRKGNYANAITKDEAALKDIEAVRFEDPEDHDTAVARVYSSLVRAHSRMHDFAQTIEFEQAALSLGGANGLEHDICYSFYQLKLYRDAIDACSHALTANQANLETRYWRGRAYIDLGEPTLAADDFRAVADSRLNVRQSAAIGLSMIYFGSHDNAGALQVLNKYTYLYDETLTGKGDIAVAYNNRCYAYMELGKVQEAFDDCKASLRFGSIPDAFKKQEELRKLLTAVKL